MSEDTQAGDDQQTEEVAGDDQQTQTPDEVAELKAKLEETQEELKETNAFITRTQQENARQKDEPQAPADEVVQYDANGNPVTRQQIENAKRMFGFDKTEQELAELKRKLEEQEVQTNTSRIDSQFDELEKEYGKKGLKVPKTRAERQEFLNKAIEMGTNNPRIAFEHINRAKLFELQTKETKKAPVPDRGENPSQEKDDTAYYKAIEDARDATGKVPAHKLAELRVKFGKASLTN